MVPRVPPCQLTRIRLHREQAPRSIPTLWACIDRWKLHALVPAIPEEGTTTVGVKIKLLIGYVLSFPHLFIFLDERY
jgi:hypothetical protein